MAAIAAPMEKAATQALLQYFNPVRIMKAGTPDGSSGLELVVVLKSFDSKNLRAYCEQALSNLKIRDYTVQVLGHHSRGIKINWSKCVGFNVVHGSELEVNIVFTGPTEAQPDGTSDPYFLRFYTEGQKAKCAEEAEKHGPGLEAVVASLKVAAEGKGFKDYFLELITQLEFDEYMKGSALSVAKNQLGHKGLRSIECPVTKTTIYARGPAEAGTADTETMVEALMLELKEFKFVDADGSGAIDVNELVAALEAEGMGNAAARAAELLTKYDASGDGILQEEEYGALFAELFGKK